MPTLYDNFSQVRQYIDQEKPDLTSYVTKTELANCSYVTNSVLSSYLPLTGGTLTGDLTISNTYVLTLGTERPWQIYERGTGAGAYIVMKGGSNKKFYIADQYTNPIIEHLSNNSSSNYVKIHTDITYTNNILPNTNNYYKLGNNNYKWNTTYTYNLYSSNIILSDGYNWIKNVSNTQIDFGVNQYNRAKLTNTEFCPSSNNGIKLGTSTNQWNRTYTGYLYLNGTNIIDTINGIFSYDSSTGTLTITTIS